MEIKLKKQQREFIHLFKKAMLNELEEFKFAQYRVREGGISIFLFKNKPQKNKLPIMAGVRTTIYPIDLLVNFEVDKRLNYHDKDFEKNKNVIDKTMDKIQSIYDLFNKEGLEYACIEYNVDLNSFYLNDENI